MLLRVQFLEPHPVINGVHAVIASVVEAKAGDVDERFNTKFKHTDIEPADLAGEDEID
ncbi:hypothetical protein [Haladaptatus salinisoli]|uniref:hypothetical protein n=1 Tax=Haladaptatus salinisoli TaxID=2884876 RepID=UPI001D0B3201|nr:hypothetical protein [Haladaptatus salinisoli]